MLKFTLSAAAVLGLALSPLAAAPALAQDAAAPAAPAAKTWSGSSSIVDAIRDPAAKAVLAKHIPDTLPMIEEYGDQIPPEFTIEMMADYPESGVTPDKLKLIVEDLAKL